MLLPSGSSRRKAQRWRLAVEATDWCVAQRFQIPDLSSALETRGRIWYHVDASLRGMLCP